MPPRPENLRARLGAASLWGAASHVDLRDLKQGSVLDDATVLEGANVLIRTSDQLFAALALIELDGVAARMVIAPPDLKDEHLPSVIERAAIDTLVTDGDAIEGLHLAKLSLPAKQASRIPAAVHKTEWVMFTSGTTGIPKMVAHSLEGLTGAIAATVSAEKIVWGTFYDIRRYGGLQILLRALIGKASLVLSDAAEPVADFLARLGREGVTHLTGTPSHWRRALMSPAIANIHPRYVRLSGEIADQAILDSLKKQFPNAAMGHAYASTEAGVGFEVTDGLEGFPASYIGRPGAVELKIVDGTLHVRSPRNASGYVGQSVGESGSDKTKAESLKVEGFVNSGDMIEQRGDRYYFMGRRGGIINVGGLKIHPEEVEAVINRQPGVRISRVSGRKNPITGSIVVAEVVAAETEGGATFDANTLKEEILKGCRNALPVQKVPAQLRFVPTLEMTAGGKLARRG